MVEFSYLYINLLYSLKATLLIMWAFNLKHNDDIFFIHSHLFTAGLTNRSEKVEHLSISKRLSNPYYWTNVWTGAQKLFHIICFCCHKKANVIEENHENQWTTTMNNETLTTITRTAVPCAKRKPSTDVTNANNSTFVWIIKTVVWIILCWKFKWIKEY